MKAKAQVQMKAKVQNYRRAERHLTFAVDSDRWQKVREIAQRERTTVSDVLRSAIDFFLEHYAGDGEGQHD